jgi:hypothetical protein
MKATPSLPRRLGDPLLTIRNQLIPLAFFPPLSIVLVMALQGIYKNLDFTSTLLILAISIIISVGFGVLSSPWVVFMKRVLPNRPPDALYLRSFRRDVGTTIVRQTIQSALGPEFRLAGVRDPRVHLPSLVRDVLAIFYVLRYATLKHMNLEAGPDWLPRLWRSLGDVRCAIVDLRDITGFVEQEIRLTLACLGPERVLFIGDGSRGAGDWMRLVQHRLKGGISGRGEPRIAIWRGDAPPERSDFAADVAAFVKHLPQGPAGLAWSAYPLVQHAIPSRARRLAAAVSFLAYIASTFVLGLVIASGLPRPMVSLVKTSTANYLAIFIPLQVVMLLLMVSAFITYVRESGSRERDARVWRAFLSGIFASGVLAPAVTVGFIHLDRWAHQKRLRVVSDHNLRIIAQALHSYEMVNGHLPPRYLADHDGAPIHSWRVLILLYLGKSELYTSYDMKEPWNGPNNRRLLGSIPTVYRHPDDQDPSSTATRILALAGPDTAFPGASGISSKDVTDGLRNTLFLVEVPLGMEVPWTAPQDLDSALLLNVVRNPAGKRPQSNGVECLFGDGTVRSLTEAASPSVLNSIRSIAGGEPVDLQ